MAKEEYNEICENDDIEIFGTYDKKGNLIFTPFEIKIIHKEYETIYYTKMNNYYKTKKSAKIPCFQPEIKNDKRSK